MNADAQPRLRRRWIRIALGVFAGGLLCVSLVAWGLMRTPGWYAPEQMPAERSDRQTIRNRLVEAEQAFTHELLRGQPFKYHIYEQYVNEWLAMRYDLYPRIDEVVTPIVRDPFVSIGSGRVRLAAKYEVANRDAIVSADFAPSFEDGEIRLRFEGVRCGSIPIPNVLEAFDLDQRVDLGRDEAWPGSPMIEGSLVHGIRIGPRGWWQNGGVDYEVTDVEVGDGVLTFSVTPLARQAKRSRH